MSESERSLADQVASDRARRGMWPRRWRWKISLALALLLALTLGIAWFSRERIAGDVIDDLIEQNGLSATYEIVSIDPNRQVIANLVIGDPARPDFTAERMVVNLDHGLRAPRLEKISLTGARAYGVWREGRLSFGSLDPLIYTDSDEPPALPAIDLALRDGRALIETEWGDIGIFLEGEGQLDDGFAGIVAASAPDFGSDGCRASVATAYGRIATQSGVPSFDGPLRLRGLDCGGASLASADIAADFALTDDFAGASGGVALRAVGMGGYSLAARALSGEAGFSWSDRGLNLRHDLTVRGLTTQFARIERLAASGSLRGGADLGDLDWDLDLDGDGMAVPSSLRRDLDEVRKAAAGTLAEPLMAKLDRNLASALSGGDFGARATIRRAKAGLAIAIPQARLKGSRGDTLLAISRASWSSGANGRLVGNFVTGGSGLPRMTGRMERARRGGLALRMTMAEYAAGSSRLAIPRLQVLRTSGDRYEIRGLVSASGPFPGGRISGLRLPIEGAWSPSGGLVLWRRCIETRFGALTYANLELTARSLSLCPGDNRAIVRHDRRLEIDAFTRDLSLEGRLAGSPARLRAARAAFSTSRGFSLDDLRGVIGAEGRAVRLTARTLRGTSGDGLAGTFEAGTARLDAVPLDLSEMSGNWGYRDSRLLIDEGSFILTERTQAREIPQARFEPLRAEGATLTLANSTIEANAVLRHPASGRLVTEVDVEHDLSSGRGEARLAVPGLLFDRKLRPQDLSYLALGVVAFADGTITGQGNIRWVDGEVASTGKFATKGLDLAAAFGPVKGLKGEIEFTDLLGLTTAPDQVLEIASLNPGLEVIGGRVRYSLTNGELIRIGDARWPFMGGTLILRPVDIRYGEDGPIRYVFEVIGLDAAQFVAQMNLSNFSATGIFDGTVPIAFDDRGNGTIDDGLLISRPPGGNVAYVGELTYEDMGAIANFAFQSLRSLDYRQMAVTLDGSLAGEIVTSFRIDGVTQGVGAKRNFVTRRLAKLPIRFNINVRSQNFYQLATMVKSFFDAEYLGNPVDRGLLRNRDGRLVPGAPFEQRDRPQQDPAPPSPRSNRANDPAVRDDEPPVQPSESGDLP